MSSEVAKLRKRGSSKSVNLLADRVLAYLRKHRVCLFSDLAEEFPEFIEGRCDLDLMGSHHSNVVAWSGLTVRAHRAINLLQKRGEIAYRPLQPIERIAHRIFLELPIANRPLHYRNIHWLPVAISAAKH